MMNLICLLAGTVVIYCMICRIALVHFGAHNPLVICAYIMMAAWSALQGGEILFAGGTATKVDTIGLFAVALYMLADMQRWRRGVPAELFRRESDRRTCG